MTGFAAQPVRLLLLGVSVTVVVLSLRTTLLFDVLDLDHRLGRERDAAGRARGLSREDDLRRGPKIGTAEPGLAAVVSVVVVTEKPAAA